MIEKIEELKILAKEAALLAKSKFDEPIINLMWMHNGEIVLTLYAPSLRINAGEKNHEYIEKSINALAGKLDSIINKVKSERYKKR
jgi:ribosome-associated translation inhibitor RaiA